MIVKTAEIRLYAPFVHSLKEKRMVVKSLIMKIKNRFNVSVAEIEEQDTHQTIVLGIACVAASPAYGENIIDKVVGFIEASCEAEIVAVFKESR